MASTSSASTAAQGQTHMAMEVQPPVIQPISSLQGLLPIHHQTKTRGSLQNTPIGGIPSTTETLTNPFKDVAAKINELTDQLAQTKADMAAPNVPMPVLVESGSGQTNSTTTKYENQAGGSGSTTQLSSQVSTTQQGSFLKPPFPAPTATTTMATTTMGNPSIQLTTPSGQTSSLIFGKTKSTSLPGSAPQVFQPSPVFGSIPMTLGNPASVGNLPLSFPNQPLVVPGGSKVIRPNNRTILPNPNAALSGMIPPALATSPALLGLNFAGLTTATTAAFGPNTTVPSLPIQTGIAGRQTASMSPTLMGLAQTSPMLGPMAGNLVLGAQTTRMAPPTMTTTTTTIPASATVLPTRGGPNTMTGGGTRPYIHGPPRRIPDVQPIPTIVGNNHATGGHRPIQQVSSAPSSVNNGIHPNRNGMIPSHHKRILRTRRRREEKDPDESEIMDAQKIRALHEVDPHSEVFPEESTLFIGDIPRTVGEHELFEFFSKAGDIDEVDIKRDKVTKNNLGYAFVKFKERSKAEGAKKTMNHMELGGRMIRIDWARKNTNLFCGDLDDRMDSDRLKEIFRGFGPLYDADTYVKPNKYGFVKFKHRKHAEKAKSSLDGKYLVIPGLFDTNRHPIRTERPIRIGWGDANTQRNCVHVQFDNVRAKAAGLSEANFEEEFSEFGTVKKVSLPRFMDGTLKGYGFVHFEENDPGEEAAARAITTLSNGDVGGVAIRCNFGKRQNNRPGRRSNNSHGHPGGHPHGGHPHHPADMIDHHGHGHGSVNPMNGYPHEMRHMPGNSVHSHSHPHSHSPHYAPPRSHPPPSRETGHLAGPMPMDVPLQMAMNPHGYVQMGHGKQQMPVSSSQVPAPQGGPPPQISGIPSIHHQMPLSSQPFIPMRQAQQQMISANPVPTPSQMQFSHVPTRIPAPSSQYLSGTNPVNQSLFSTNLTPAMPPQLPSFISSHGPASSAAMTSQRTHGTYLNGTSPTPPLHPTTSTAAATIGQPPSTFSSAMSATTTLAPGTIGGARFPPGSVPISPGYTPNILNSVGLAGLTGAIPPSPPNPFNLSPHMNVALSNPSALSQVAPLSQIPLNIPSAPSGQMTSQTQQF